MLTRIISQHDAQLDYYGKRLATCSSDRTVRVFDVVDGEPQRGAGQVLKGCGVHVYPPQLQNQLMKASGCSVGTLARCGKSHGHTPSLGASSRRAPTTARLLSGRRINQVTAGRRLRSTPFILPLVRNLLPRITRAWPTGPVLCSKLCELGTPRTRCDPCVRLLGRQDLGSHLQKSVQPFVSVSPMVRSSHLADDGHWGADIFDAHGIGCNAVSWAPATPPGSLIQPGSGPAAPAPGAPASAVPAGGAVKRFASAGCDNVVRIWAYRDDAQSWVEEDALEGHADWVRDVAWAPNIGLPRSYIATASQVRPIRASVCLKIFIYHFRTRRC